MENKRIMKHVIFTILAGMTVVIGCIQVMIWREQIDSLQLPTWLYLPLGLAFFFVPIGILVRKCYLKIKQNGKEQIEIH